MYDQGIRMKVCTMEAAAYWFNIYLLKYLHDLNKSLESSTHNGGFGRFLEKKTTPCNIYLCIMLCIYHKFSLSLTFLLFDIIID